MHLRIDYRMHLRIDYCKRFGDVYCRGVDRRIRFVIASHVSRHRGIEGGSADMPKYLVLHTLDLTKLPKDPTGSLWSGTDKLLGLFTRDCHCVVSWIGLRGFYTGKAACLWEAPSKEAIVAMLRKAPIAPVDEIFDSTMVVDWAEEKKKRAAKAKPVAKKTKAASAKPAAKKKPAARKK